MGAGHAIAIDLGRTRLRAIYGTRLRGSIRVRGVMIEDVPPDLASDDPEAVGAWVGQRLKAAGFPRSRAIIALGREHVGFKRMSLPTAEDAELPEMTRLAMQRELPFSAETAVIDFVPVQRSQSSTTVLAVAAPAQVIDSARRMSDAAGLGIDRITLRTMGAAALLRSMETPEARGPEDGVRSASTPAAVLGVEISGDGVEFCIVVDGSIRVSRAAEVPRPADEPSITEAVITEARRTWMSYQAAGDSAGIVSALLMGEPRVAASAAEPVGEMLKARAQILKEHPRIDAAGHDIQSVWPLAGLLLESLLGEPVIDLASPRKAPDVNARKRMRRVLMAGAAVLAFMTLWTVANLHLKGLRGDLKELDASIADLRPDYARHMRDSYKLEHLRQWDSVKVDWLSHASYLTTIAPPPDQVVLDSWAGTLDFRGVLFDRKTFKWSTSEQLTIVIDGEAKDRATADSFREGLVQKSIYNTASTGADTKGGKRMPFGFTYRLRSQVGMPKPSPVATPSEAPAASGATGEHTVIPTGNLPPAPDTPMKDKSSDGANASSSQGAPPGGSQP